MEYVARNLGPGSPADGALTAGLRTRLVVLDTVVRHGTPWERAPNRLHLQVA
jgi:hypothetical protein